MSEPLPGDFTSEEMRSLLGGVQALAANAGALKELPDKVDALSASNAKLTRRGFWNRFWIWISLIGLMADVVVSVFIWRFEVQQQCLSDLRVQTSQLRDK